MQRERFVEPYEGRVVRAERAAELVVPMPESGDETPTAFDPGAYGPERRSLYRYRQTTTTGTHTGIVCLMDAAAFADGRVRGHEQVLPERVDALVAHLSAGPAHVELVTTLHRAGPRFSDVLEADDANPRVDVTTADGVRHTVWPVASDDELLAELDGARHYLADGHHRVAASLRLWEQSGRPAGTSVAVVAYALDGLSLEAHRRPPGEEVAVPTLEEILALADEGRTVAPKTTWFRPKPASGLFVREA